MVDRSDDAGDQVFSRGVDRAVIDESLAVFFAFAWIVTQNLLRQKLIEITHIKIYRAHGMFAVDTTIFALLSTGTIVETI